MGLRDMVVRNRRMHLGRDETAAAFAHLQRNLNDLFDNFWRSTSDQTADHIGDFSPSIEVSESEKAIDISAELPGMTEKDIDVSVSNDARMLTIRGEKRSEHEVRERDMFRAERRYGAFRRTVGLPVGVAAEHAEATFKDGLLRLRLPKLPEEAQAVKHIAIKKAP